MPGATPVIGGTLNLILTLTDLQSGAMLWTATVTCTIATSDTAALAREIGGLVGRTLGSNIVGQPI